MSQLLLAGTAIPDKRVGGGGGGGVPPTFGWDCILVLALCMWGQAKAPRLFSTVSFDSAGDTCRSGTTNGD